MTGDFKYDVAFSFLAQDEPLAMGLNDLIQERVRTFLYSKRQGEIAGTDGEEQFNTVFGEQARLVVVLYRLGWGETPWTRIEETAIRNRAFEQGYDFVKFIPLDEPPTVPKWLPRTQLWVGLKRWGAAGAASVIEARIQELGGEAHEETVEERAERLDRSLRFSERRRQFLNSEEGVRAANLAVSSLHAEIDRLVSSIKSSASAITIQLSTDRNTAMVYGLGPALCINWLGRYGNTLRDSKLEVTVWDRPVSSGTMYFEKPKKLASLCFTFDLLPTEHYFWKRSEETNGEYETIELAQFILKYYMDYVNAQANSWRWGQG